MKAVHSRIFWYSFHLQAFFEKSEGQEKNNDEWDCPAGVQSCSFVQREVGERRCYEVIVGYNYTLSSETFNDHQLCMLCPFLVQPSVELLGVESS